ncbi:MAG: winged helix-turn-helix domain-containing protein [Acidobacteriota bacterium]|nr:winged helix-turn-helix domain-containing protein [Acidobacteriota bacterium]
MIDRPNENLLSRLEQSLRQSRAARMHLAARLRELESEADAVRAELAEMDTLASQTEAAIYRLLSSVLASGNLSMSSLSGGLPSDAELEAAMRHQSPPLSRAPLTVESRRQEIPTLRPNTEALSDRFMDRTIPQAVTLLLREEGGSLHVNEIYNRLLEGGFRFTGQNPTISIAVSLNRNTRFRKVAPGTFDLMIRDASKAS